jgi:hypothetical protein
MKIVQAKSVLLSISLGGNPAGSTVGGLQLIEDLATSYAESHGERGHDYASFAGW